MPDDVETFLADLPPEVETIARALRTRIRALVPDAVEQRHGGWKIIGYSVDGSMKSSICAIAPHSAHVNLQFFRGTELEDPEGLLEGSGKSGRHVKLRNASDVDGVAVGRLVEQAASLAAGR
jgi:hypothetical protein